MPSLGDVLGNLMAEVTRARVQADLETVRVAEAYAAHPLLKHFSVPRFRLPDVTLDVPMVINRVDSSPTEAPKLDLFRGAFQEILEAQLTKLRLPKIFARELSEALDAVVRKAEPEGKNVNLLNLADMFTEAASSKLRLLPQLLADQGDFESRLRTAARSRFVDLRPAGTQIDVTVGTQELRDVPPANVTRFRLSVKENAVEWTTIEKDDRVESRLVPE